MMPHSSATKAQTSRLVRTAIASLSAIYFLIANHIDTPLDSPASIEEAPLSSDQESWTSKLVYDFVMGEKIFLDTAMSFQPITDKVHGGWSMNEYVCPLFHINLTEL
jgi:hypothetical protein